MKTSLIEFPCDFILKIMGQHTSTFVDEIFAISHQHYPQLTPDALQTQLSKNGHYIALTLTVYAENQSTLDALYLALTKHPDVKMVL